MTLLPSVVGVCGDELAISVTLRHMVGGGVKFREADDVMSVVLRHDDFGEGNCFSLGLPFPNHHSIPYNTPITTTTTLGILFIRIDFYSDDLRSGVEEDGSGQMFPNRIRFGFDNRGGGGSGSGSRGRSSGRSSGRGK